MYARCKAATSSDTHSHSNASEFPIVSWDNLGFNPLPTDYIYVMKCSEGKEFTDGELQPYGKIQLNPFSSMLNYGQGVIEGLKAYKKDDGSMLLFRVLANRRRVLSSSKGFLHIRLLLIGSGPLLQLTTSPEFIFMIYDTPARDYFEVFVCSFLFASRLKLFSKFLHCVCQCRLRVEIVFTDFLWQEGTKPIDLLVENEVHRAVPGGVGEIKAAGKHTRIGESTDAS